MDGNSLSGKGSFILSECNCHGPLTCLVVQMRVCEWEPGGGEKGREGEEGKGILYCMGVGLLLSLFWEV